MDLKHRLLWEAFGYTEFRPGQQKLIDAMLAGRDVLGVMPTGAGKSICYQISAMLLPGLSLVISPLISLMQDQIAALHRAGIAACMLNSAQTVSERREAMHNIANGRCKLIYIAPERLLTPDFCELVAQLPVSMVAVDEAHCISQWGHDFRPSYRKIPQFLRNLPRRPIISAFTATATAQVREDIVQALQLQNPERLVTSFDRPNLYYEVRRVSDREDQLLRFLNSQNGASGIIYCLTRKKTEQLTKSLQNNGISALAYHGGMEPMVRRQVQRQFVSGKIPVIVATNAFGMGIDKPDVRFVVHFGMPRDIESYYQEAGRAGRDGAPAYCMLLFDEKDIGLHQYLMEQDPENPDLTDEEVAWLKRQNWKRLERMKRYVFTETCLRQHILQYFGQEAMDFCGQCSNCEASSVQKDVTTEAQKILSCVYRVHEQCSMEMLCRILRGTDDADIMDYHTVSTFGIMRDNTQEEILIVIQHLISIGCLVQQDNPNRLCLSTRAKPILFQGKTVSIRVQVSQQEARLTRASRISTDPELSKKLRLFRKKLAGLRGVPAFLLFSDKLLEQLVRELPQNEAKLSRILGEKTRLRQRDKQKLLNILQEYRDSHL